jgi:hypothetical protein
MRSAHLLMWAGRRNAFAYSQFPYCQRTSLTICLYFFPSHGSNQLPSGDFVLHMDFRVKSCRIMRRGTRSLYLRLSKHSPLSSLLYKRITSFPRPAFSKTKVAEPFLPISTTAAVSYQRRAVAVGSTRRSTTRLTNLQTPPPLSLLPETHTPT